MRVCTVVLLSAQSLFGQDPDAELRAALGREPGAEFFQALRTITRGKRADLGAALDTTLRRVAALPVRGRERALLGLFDAMIQTGHRPPAGLVAGLARAQPLSDPMRGALVVLMSAAPARFREGLRAVHRRAAAEPRSLGICFEVTGQLLASVRDPDFAVDCLRGMTVHAHLDLRMPGEVFGVTRCGAGGGFGGSSRRHYRFPRGWPRFGVYRLLRGREIETARKRLARGIEVHGLPGVDADLAYQRQYHASRAYEVRSSHSHVHPSSLRHDYLARMLEVEPKALGFPLQMSGELTWVDEKGYRTRIDTLRRVATRRLRALRERLVAARLCPPELAASLEARLVVEVTDLRGQDAPKLPELEGVFVR